MNFDLFTDRKLGQSVRPLDPLFYNRLKLHATLSRRAKRNQKLGPLTKIAVDLRHEGILFRISLKVCQYFPHLIRWSFNYNFCTTFYHFRILSIFLLLGLQQLFLRIQRLPETNHGPVRIRIDIQGGTIG